MSARFFDPGCILKRVDVEYTRHLTIEIDEIKTGGVLSWLIINPQKKEIVRPRFVVYATK